MKIKSHQRKNELLMRKADHLQNCTADLFSVCLMLLMVPFFATVETMNGSMLLRFAVVAQNDKLWTV
jgi:hypothetical protein